jgi:hypothetical protein
MNPNHRNFALWIITILLVVALVMLFVSPGKRVPSQELAFSQLLNEVDQGHVREVTIAGNEIKNKTLNEYLCKGDIIALRQRLHAGQAKDMIPEGFGPWRLSKTRPGWPGLLTESYARRPLFDWRSCGIERL